MFAVAMTCVTIRKIITSIFLSHISATLVRHLHLQPCRSCAFRLTDKNVDHIFFDEMV